MEPGGVTGQLARVVTLFIDITRSYFVTGWPFLLLHVGVIYFVWRDLRDFRRWAFDASQPDMWQEYESRSQRLRGQVGLFLVIGIAGSFFGLFELASWDGDPKTFRFWLTSALQRAFPVGFYGVLLYMAGNFLADQAEDAKVPLGGRRSRGQAAMVGLLEAIERKLGGLPDALTASLRPIASLQETLQQALAPTVQEIGGVLRAQGDQLTRSRAALEQAAQGLVAAAADLSAAIGDVKGVSAQVAMMTRAATGSAEAAQALLTTTEDRLAAAFGQVEVGLARTDSLMSNIEAHAKGAFDTLADTAGERLRQTEMQAGATLQAITTHTATTLEMQSALLAKSDESLLSAVERQQELLTDTRTAIEDATATASENLKQGLAQLLSDHQLAMGASRDALASVGNDTKLAAEGMARAHLEGTQRVVAQAELLHTSITATYDGLQRTLQEAIIRSGESFGTQVASSARSALEPVKDYVQLVEQASRQASQLVNAAAGGAATQISDASDSAVSEITPLLSDLVLRTREAAGTMGAAAQQIEDLAKGLQALNDLERSSRAAALAASELKGAFDALRPSIRQPPQGPPGGGHVPPRPPRRPETVWGRIRALWFRKDGEGE